MGGKAVKLFLVDGTPGGLTTAEIGNWTGHVLSAPRSAVGALLGRPEVTGTCVYLLLGESEDGRAKAYIGETDDFRARLTHHHRNKPFWDRVVVITSKDANLTKAHGRYLESKLVRLAQNAGRVELENGNDPGGSTLPESDASDMDYFVDQLQIVLPVLGVNAIRVPEVRRPGPEASASVEAGVQDSPVFMLKNAKHGYDARAQQIDGEFVLLAGSIIAPKVRESDGYRASTARAYAGYAAQHEALVAEGAIIVEGSTARTTRNIVLGSPSTAGALVEGRSCNGRSAWLLPDGTPFGAWESRGVAAAPVADGSDEG